MDDLDLNEQLRRDAVELWRLAKIYLISENGVILLRSTIPAADKDDK